MSPGTEINDYILTKYYDAFQVGNAYNSMYTVWLKFFLKPHNVVLSLNKWEISFTVYFTCGHLKGFWKRRNTDACNYITLYYIISVIKCKTRNRKEQSQQYSSGSCPEMRPHIRWMLFEIGIVWENVDEILNHPVAEVVLLLEEETRGELSLPASAIYVQKTFPGSTDVKRLSVSAQQIWRYLFFHLPQSEPCVVSACVNS